MTRQDEQQRVTETLPEVEGISADAIARAKAMIGSRLRTENFVRDASLGRAAQLRQRHRRHQPHFFGTKNTPPTPSTAPSSGIPVPPTCAIGRGAPAGDLPGVHGFFAGNDWEFFRHLRPGDAVNCVERVLDVQEKQSKYSATLVIQYVETIYTNQRDELVARVVGWCTRHQRRASRERGKYADVPKRHEYTPDELEAIDQQVLNEKARGGAARYYEDTNVGDELEPIIRGPLSLQDVSAFLVGTGRSSAHGVLLREALRHPGPFLSQPRVRGAGWSTPASAICGTRWPRR